MKDVETRCLEMFERVVSLGDAESERFAANAYVTGIFDELRQLIVDLQARADAQAAGLASARQSTQNKTASREELLRVVTAMSRTARSIPGQAENFRFDQYHDDQELLTAARTFAAQALPIKAEFIKRGMRIDFLEVLQAAADALEQALSARAERTRTHVDATATIDDLIEAGLKKVRELDTIMRNAFEDDPGKLAAWLSASHVERAPRRNRPAPTAPTA